MYREGVMVNRNRFSPCALGGLGGIDCDTGSMTQRLLENRQRRGRDSMLGRCPPGLRALLASASFITGDAARELSAVLPWPTRLRTLLPGGLAPSRSGVRQWQFREYPRWLALSEDLALLPLARRGFGYLYLGDEVPVFLVELAALAPLLGELARYLGANRCGECAVAGTDMASGFIVTRAADDRPCAAPEAVVFQLCTWGMAQAIPN